MSNYRQQDFFESLGWPDHFVEELPQTSETESVHLPQQSSNHPDLFSTPKQKTPAPEYFGEDVSVKRPRILS